ncbi:MAG: acetylxylan esterase [Pirellulales bacterium]|nr:acetylxylan esterase [Pirellulales bacterium]
MVLRLDRSILVIATLAVSLLIAAVATADPATPQSHFTATTPAEATHWQEVSRQSLFNLLKLSDLVAQREKSVTAVPFDAKVLSTEDHGSYSLREIELNSTSTRRIKAVLTLPTAGKNRAPAVVCIHGHGGNRRIVYDRSSIYHGFADELASRGFVTISTEVGQHNVYEQGRSLMGERLWDLIRCADYLTTLERVDADRMGCAGLSLGGEMSMWLGAMDPRMKAVVSSGFLTTVENMRHGHCPCWDFPGLTEQFDFCDIYSLTAPRALLCQIGNKERAPGGFPKEIARPAMTEIRRAYAVFGDRELARMDVHPAGHVFETEAGMKFISAHLQPKK